MSELLTCVHPWAQVRRYEECEDPVCYDCGRPDLLFVQCDSCGEILEEGWELERGKPLSHTWPQDARDALARSGRVVEYREKPKKPQPGSLEYAFLESFKRAWHGHIALTELHKGKK